MCSFSLTVKLVSIHFTPSYFRVCERETFRSDLFHSHIVRHWRIILLLSEKLHPSYATLLLSCLPNILLAYYTLGMDKRQVCQISIGASIFAGGGKWSKPYLTSSREMELLYDWLETSNLGTDLEPNKVCWIKAQVEWLEKTDEME